MQPGLMLPQISCPVPFNFRPNPKTVSLRLTCPVSVSTQTTVLPSARAGPLNRVDVLSESLSFIDKFFYGKIVVVKYGGAAMKLSQLREITIKDLDLLACVGLRLVLVHDGGPEYNSCLTRNIKDEHKFIPGVRIRNKSAKKVVKMVLMTTVISSLYDFYLLFSFLLIC
jgi:acetylglutamate kinase